MKVHSGDIDGFFGLAVDNLIQFLLILGLCGGVLGFPTSLLLGQVLPAAALSILVGNLYYARLARQLAETSRREDVTALPYGINTVSLFAFIFLVMLPAKLTAQAGGASPEEAARLAWQVGLAACFCSAVIELLGAPCADWIRRHTPRAALLATLSGIAISFIAIDFAVRTFERPLIAMLPLTVLLVTYFSGVRLPWRIPGGAWALLLGTFAAWLMTLWPESGTPVAASTLPGAFAQVGFHPPVPVLGDLWAGLMHPMTRDFFIPVILPMGLFNVLGSLQNLESAEAAGDRYPSAPCMLVNGLGSLVAAAFGSCFPTTLYIGHPGWKALGARAAYSSLNGIFFAVIAFFGLSSTVSALIPVEAGMAIILWIGIVITAQAFVATPARHAPAVALGLFPAIAAWGTLVLTQALNAAGIVAGDTSLADRTLANPAAFLITGAHLDGLVALSQGFMLTCLVWAASSALLIDRRFNAATGFMLVGATLSFFGFMHAGTLGAAGATYVIAPGAGWSWALAYLLCAVFLWLTGRWAIATHQTEASPPPH